MVNSMEYELVGLLMNKDYDTICSTYRLYNFQAQMLCYMYESTNIDSLKSRIIEHILDGSYSSEDKVRGMFKSFIDKAIRCSKDNGFNILVEKCKLSEIDATSFITNYTIANRNLDEMLSAELEVSNTNIKMNEMINEIMPAFLDSEKEKKL